MTSHTHTHKHTYTHTHTHTHEPLYSCTRTYPTPCCVHVSRCTCFGPERLMQDKQHAGGIKSQLTQRWIHMHIPSSLPPLATVPLRPATVPLCRPNPNTANVAHTPAHHNSTPTQACRDSLGPGGPSSRGVCCNVCVLPDKLPLQTAHSRHSYTAARKVGSMSGVSCNVCLLPGTQPPSTPS